MVLVVALAMPSMASGTELGSATATPAKGPFDVKITAKTGGHKYEFYQIFKATLQNITKDTVEEEVLTNISWGDGIDPTPDERTDLLTALKSKFADNEAFTTITANETDGVDNPHVAREMHIQNLCYK